MTLVSISRDARRPIQVGRYARNDRPPTAAFQNQLAETAGFAASVRSHVLFRSHGGLVIPSSAGGGAERVRGRFAFHSGPFASLLSVRFVMAQQDNGAATAPYARLRVATSDGTAMGDAIARFGSATSATDVPSSFGERTSTLVSPDNEDNEIVFLDPDTDYLATLTEHDYARVQSVLVREISLTADTVNGYAGMVGIGGDILARDRSTTVSMARMLYTRGGAHSWNWYADTDADAPVLSSATFTNLIDETSTTVDGFSPGATLDFRSRARHKDADEVPVVMKVYASSSTGDGEVRMVDLDGTLLSVPITSTAGWYAVSGMVPATRIKYDLHAAASTGTVTVYAVSIYQCDSAATEALATGPGYLRIHAFDATGSMS